MLTKAEATRKLARLHYELEPELARIFTVCEAPEREQLPMNPIKLLEVHASTVPSGLMPLQFGPAPASGIPYPSVIIEVTPDEFEQIRRQELLLPGGWSLGEEIFRGAESAGAA